MRLNAQFFLQGVNKGAKHVKQHAFAALSDHLQHLHVHQSGENDGLNFLKLGRVVNLPHGLVRFVGAVDERQANMPAFHFKLGQYGVSKGFGGDTGAI
jgi:hypothetical protein